MSKHIYKIFFMATVTFFAFMVSLAPVHISNDPQLGNIATASDELPPPGQPKRLIIPKIHVDADILHIGLTPEGAVGVPEDARNTSWFNLGPRPGQKGSAVISGHYGIWKGGTDSVFNLLDTLEAGDSFQIEDDKGAIRTFMVKTTKVYSKDDTTPEIFNKADASYVNIITCHGQYLPEEKTYSQRLVVFAELQK